MHDEIDDFEIYRPAVTSGRLEPTYVAPHPTNWRPSVSYKHSLQDIQTQFTPSEMFRYRLQTAGKEIRLIQKLETRWNKNFASFCRSALRIQALFRGNKGRAYFLTIKEDLRQDLERRRSYLGAKGAFLSGQFEDAVLVCKNAEQHPEELLLIQIKAEYRLGRFQDCVITAEKIVATNQRNEDAYFLSACSFCQLYDYPKAMEQLRMVTILKASCTDETYRLFAGVAVKLEPPEYDNAIDSISQIIRRKPQEFEALLQRAHCYCCIQEWSDALIDIEVILAFQPTHVRALLLRGRVHTCLRDWENANLDYNFILLHYPGNQVALDRLKAISLFVSDAIKVED